MEKSQSELTDKIRSAIKRKLIEINAFVDDELPDYIMILVANKRSKAHMEKDLTLFLGKDTVEFTNWLWELVSNLKVNSKLKQIGKLQKTDDEKKGHSDEDADILDYNLGESEGDLDQDEGSLDSRPMLTECLEISESTTKPTFVANKSTSTNNTECKKTTQRAKVYPMQAVIGAQPSSTLNLVSRKVNHDVEYDPMKPEFSGNVSSVVRVSQRNCTRPALQANKLLLRAVDDATKSVLDGKSIKDYYKPTPINVLSSTKQETNNFCQFSNPVNSKNNARLDLNSIMDIKNEKPSNFSDHSNDLNVNVMEQEQYILSGASHKNRTICLPTSDIDVELDDQSSSFVEQKSDSPHFIVTLDGVDFSSFKRKYSDYSDEESMEVDEEGPSSRNTIISNTAPVKKQKVIERCKYWPACKNKDNCTYHHPTILCKSFPDCKYGDKCLYIHPTCKFDSLCTRKECRYTHVSKRNFHVQPVPVNVRKPRIICKFFPKCTVKNCIFIHPKSCRYGGKCRLPVCPYIHFNIPSRNQLKWKADTSFNV